MAGTTSTINLTTIEANLKANKAYWIPAGIFVLAGIVFTLVNLKYMQHPIMQLLITLLVAALFLWVTYHICVTTAAEAKGAAAIKFGVAVLVYFFIAYGVGNISHNNRNQCIPKAPLSDAHGYIADPQAFINFHANCQDNAVIYDAPTQEYIKANHKLPSWLMRTDGYTSDPVQWWIYYQSSPSNPYPNLDEHVHQQLLQTNYLPDSVLHHK